MGIDLKLVANTLSVDDWTEAFTENRTELYNTAIEKGVDVDSIINELYASYTKSTKNWKMKSIVKFIATQVKNSISFADAEQFDGFILGARDWPMTTTGKRTPISYAVVNSDGIGTEIRAWQGSTKGPIGTMPVPVPSKAIVGFEVTEDTGYGEQLMMLNISKYDPIPVEQLSDILDKLVIPIRDIYEEELDKSIVVVKGSISSIQNAPIYMDGQIEGKWPIITRDTKYGNDKPSVSPVFQIVINDGDDTLIATLGRRNSKEGHAMFLLSNEYRNIISDSFSDFPHMAETQAEQISSIFSDETVFVIGRVSAIRDKQYGDGLTIYLDAFGVVLPDDLIADENVNDYDIDDITNVIKQIINTLGVDPNILTTEEIKKSIPEANDDLIVAALDQFQKQPAVNNQQ